MFRSVRHHSYTAEGFDDHSSTASSIGASRAEQCRLKLYDRPADGTVSTDPSPNSGED